MRIGQYALAAFAAMAAAFSIMVVAEPYYAYKARDLLGLTGRDHGVEAHWRHSVAALKRRNDHAARTDLVFLGASTVEGLDVRHFGPGAMNLGVGGARMDHVASLVAGGDLSIEGADLVVLAGLNDLAAGRSASRNPG